MALNITVPELSESVSEATVAEWFKNVGDPVKAGDILVTLETDKVAVEVTADADGVLAFIVIMAALSMFWIGEWAEKKFPQREY